MILIPPRFFSVAYNGAHYPGAPETNGLEGGANCQQFAYELVRHNGRLIGDLRSSDLWTDEAFTTRVDDYAPLDLLLFNATLDPFGAHVAVYTGKGEAIHLCAEAGHAAVWRLREFLKRPRYSVLIGAKRPWRRNREGL